MNDFFSDVDRITYAGPDSDDPMRFRWYDPDRVVAGRTMREQLRIGVCYWHSFNWPGSDIFGDGTFDRPWLDPAADPMSAARQKMAAAFEFFTKLGTPFYSFHDVDMAPAGATFAESKRNLDEMVDLAGQYQADTGVELLWGTANLFSHPRFMSGAATNPDPELFAYAAAQVCDMLEATHRLGGDNYVLWGGREGYETLLNTDMSRELDQLARFLHLVVEHKHRIGFDGQLLLEPKPQEPTKHQYDYDVATVYGFLAKYDLLDHFKVNIEVNHATLSGHDFDHEVATAVNLGIFGSVDANAGDDRLGWDLDRFPQSVEQMSLGVYQILLGGGFDTGGFMFDTKLRRQSIDRADLFHGHIAGIDVLARSLLVAADLLEAGALSGPLEQRYAGWSGELGRQIMSGDMSLEALRDRQVAGEEPQPASGRQEVLEGTVMRYVDRAT